MLDLDAAARLVDGTAGDGTAVVLPARRDLLVVRGADAAGYLQGQVSQDVEGLAVGATSRTLLLQPQGKVDAWLRVHRLDPVTFLLDTEEGHGPAAAARLERFKLRVDATIETRTATVAEIRGPGTPSADAAAAATGRVALEAGWGGIAGLDLVDPAGDVDPATVAEALGLPVGPAELAEPVRIAQGRPAMGHELDESTIPAAAGVVDGSVDFTKGCYVGQELVARVDSRGNNTPTRLHALIAADGGPDGDPGGDGEGPRPGDELLLDGAVVGHVTSGARWPGAGRRGLAYLKRTVEAPVDLEVRSAVDGEGSSAAPTERVRMRALPLPPPPGAAAKG